MKIKGSLIVEASYIFPITILAVFVILLLAYYRHDHIVMKSEMRSFLIRNLSEEGSERFDGDALPLYYMGYDEIQFKQNEGKGELSVKPKFDVFPRFLSYDGGVGEGRMKEVYKAHRPQKVIRRWAGLMSE